MNSLALILACLVYSSTSHEWNLGRCPRVDTFPNLSVDKFLGLWYVIEQFDTTSTCLVFDYTRLSETQLELTKAREIYILKRIGIDHKNSYSATLDIPDDTNPAKMRIKWPLNVIGKSDYYIFDTDYTTYAGVYDCQPVGGYMHRESAAILSRSQTLEQEYIERVKRRLTSFNIDVSPFDKVEHKDCITPAEADFTVNVNRNTFKNILEGTADGIRDIGSQIADGVRTATGVLVNGTKQFTSNLEEDDTREPLVAKPVEAFPIEPESEIIVP